MTAIERDSGLILDAQGLTRRFGGLIAVDRADLRVRKGTVHGLIGPNGAGKTTLVNMLTGVDRPDAGSVTLEGRDTTRFSSMRLARRGVARSFQTSQLFEEEDVLSNVMAGRHQHIRYRFPNTFFYGPRTAAVERRHRRWCLELLEELNLDGMARTRVSELPYGRRRLVELARALATEPRLLVLDEPAAGLPRPDTDLLAEQLVVLASKGYTVLIIEHNIGLLMTICDSITVLAEGRVVADGRPSEVRADPHVIEAYLGRTAS